MSRQPSDLRAAIVAAIASGALVLLIPANSTVRLVFALPLLLLLPGYALTAALFPRRSIGIPEQVLFSVGLSLSVVVVGGFALHWTPWGLQAGSWAVFLAGVTVGASMLAAVRRRRGLSATTRPLNIGFDSRQGLLLALAAVVIAVAVGLGRTPMPPQGIQGYTQLWILPADNGNPNAIRLGISSKEFTATGYRLQVEMDSQIVEEWPVIQLAPGEQWETTIVLPGDSSSSGVVEAVLYRLDASDVVYRRVTLQHDNLGNWEWPPASR
jgi:hypothetical protein